MATEDISALLCAAAVRRPVGNVTWHVPRTRQSE